MLDARGQDAYLGHAVPIRPCPSTSGAYPRAAAKRAALMVSKRGLAQFSHSEPKACPWDSAPQLFRDE